MDIISFTESNKTYRAESDMRSKKLTSNIKNGKPTLRVRLDELYASIAGKVGGADEVTRLSAINLIKEHEWIDTLMVQQAYKGSYLLFDNLLDNKGLDLSKSEWVSYQSNNKRIIATNQNSFLALKAIPNSKDLGDSLHIVLNGEYYPISSDSLVPTLYYWDEATQTRLPYTKQAINQKTLILIFPLSNKKTVESYGLVFVDKAV